MLGLRFITDWRESKNEMIGISIFMTKFNYNYDDQRKRKEEIWYVQGKRSITILGQ